MDQIQSIIYIVYGVCVTAISIIGIFTGNLKLKKAKSELQNIKDNDENITDTTDAQTDETEEESKTIKLSKIVDSLTELIQTAENSGLTGLQKKAYVINMILAKCYELNLNYSEYAEYISNKIEELITFSKNVNAKEGSTDDNSGNETFRL